MESYQRERPDTKCRFTCVCVCEVNLRFKRPTWKAHHFQSVQGVRDWLLLHKEHDFAVDIQVEGLRAKDKAQAPWSRREIEAGTTAAGLSRKRCAIIAKLRALAADSPDTPEAQSAHKKAEELLAKYAEAESPQR